MDNEQDFPEIQEQLQEVILAIDETMESEKILALVAEIRALGYDVGYTLEATFHIRKRKKIDEMEPTAENPNSYDEKLMKNFGITWDD